MGMQIKRYRGADMQEALQKVKQDLGTDAIILHTRQVRGAGGRFGLFGKPLLEVTAARDANGSSEAGTSIEALEAGAGAPRKPARGRFSLRRAVKGGNGGGEDALHKALSRTRLETQQLLTPLQDDIHELREVLHTVGDAQRTALREQSSLEDIRSELSDMRQMLHMVASSAAGLREVDLPENLVALYQQLLFNGVEEKFAKRLLEEAHKNIPAKEVEDFTYVKIFLARMLMKIIRVTGGVRCEAGRQKVVALVGPTGVGKTTTVAKLASEQLLKHNRHVALVTVDTFRIAAVEQLKVYAKIMGLPITVVNDKAELQQALQQFADYDAVFIDTGGRSQRDELQMHELQNLFGGEDGIELSLVLGGTTKDADLTDITRRFGELPLSSVIFTKLDESTTYGALFNHAIRFKLPISYLTTGQKVPEDIEVASKERLVDLLLNISAS